MFKYDIVEYKNMYFVRRRLFGRFFEEFLYHSSTYYNHWILKLALIDYLENTGYYTNPYTLEEATKSYEKIVGITKMKLKHQASKAEFKVYGG